MLLVAAMIWLLPSFTPEVSAQNVQIEEFEITTHPLRQINLVTWWASEDSTLVSFGVQHSLDGVKFEDIGSVAAIFVGDVGHYYEFWHVDPPNGLNFYRLRLYFRDGTTKDSEIMKVLVGVPSIGSWYLVGPPGSIDVRPLTDNPDDQILELRVSDLYGRPIAAVQGQSEVQLPDDLPSGIYVVHVRMASGWSSKTISITQD